VARQPSSDQATIFGLPWEVKRLNEDPLKIVAVSQDREHGVARFVLEFRRTLKPSDLLQWDQRDAPYFARFLDEDEVILLTVRLRYDAEFVPEKGRRCRFAVQLPPPEVMARTRKILID
jgi:hypothetical protein